MRQKLDEILVLGIVEVQHGGYGGDIVVAAGCQKRLSDTHIVCGFVIPQNIVLASERYGTDFILIRIGIVKYYNWYYYVISLYR